MPQNSNRLGSQLVNALIFIAIVVVWTMWFCQAAVK